MAVGILKCVQQACYICLTPECIEPRRFLLLQAFENVRPSPITSGYISTYALFVKTYGSIREIPSRFQTLSVKFYNIKFLLIFI